MTTSPDPVYAGIAAFAAELVRNGVTDVVVTPGSRSTPLALTLHAQPGLRTWIQLDERSAGFFALGIGRSRGVPAVLVCTSGTAAANHLPAIVEAHHASVPIITCTADRPPELRDWGAGQTIDQVGIFGSTCRWTADLPTAGEVTPDHFRVVALRAVSSATGSNPGPVHLNWPLREPLEPTGDVPVVSPGASPRLAPAAVPAACTDLFEDVAGAERGVVVVGPSPGVGLAAEHETATAVASFAAATGWPVLAEPLTQLRRTGRADGLVVTAADRLLAGVEFAEAMEPEVVIRVGLSPTTKPVRLWLERHRPRRVVLVDPTESWNEASFTITDHLRLDPRVALGAPKTSREPGPWLDAWREAERKAVATVAEIVESGPFLSAAVTRALAGALPDESVLMVSNSMPVRDMDSLAGDRLPATVVGNRGASGIDGISSTALGLAATRPDRSAALLTGDLALLHDLGGLLAASRLGLHLTVVCVDNDGGGIFSMLPVADRISTADFEILFRTPHGLDLTGLHGFGGIRARKVGSVSELSDQLRGSMGSATPGVDLLVAVVDRDADVAQRRELTEAVAAKAAPRRR